MVGRKSPSLTLQTHLGPIIFILALPTKNAQDLKSCEGFPREGSSPSSGGQFFNRMGSYRLLVKNPRPQGRVSNAVTFFVAQ